MTKAARRRRAAQYATRAARDWQIYRRLIAGEKGSDIGADYGIDSGSISRIKNAVAYRLLAGAPAAPKETAALDKYAALVQAAQDAPITDTGGDPYNHLPHGPAPAIAA